MCLVGSAAARLFLPLLTSSLPFPFFLSLPVPCIGSYLGTIELLVGGMAQLGRLNIQRL